jgi:hypothetical protein
LDLALLSQPLRIEQTPPHGGAELPPAGGCMSAVVKPQKEKVPAEREHTRVGMSQKALKADRACGTIGQDSTNDTAGKGRDALR